MNSSRVALVTGSGRRRIGAVVAESLAEQGYSLAVHYRASAAEAREFVADLQRRGATAEAFQAELTDERAARGLIDGVVARFGRLDVLVHCAAIWRPKRLEDIVAADVREYLETNTLAAFVCMQHAGLAMVRQPEGGAIVAIGDWATERPYLDYAAYFPSKGAIPTLTRVMAVELGTRNPRVRVNCVLPGPVMLPLDLPEAERREAIDATVVKREGSPQNVALAVLHLLENDFVTGVCLPVDGGRTIYAPGPGG